MQFIGQKLNLNLIDNWSQMPNFTIIQGDKNTGKHYLVLYLCDKFKLHYINVKINVNNIRQLLDVMVPNSNTVYHLDNFDDASIQAKNALLKITEEPIEGNYIVITGGPQIKTLESRARRIIMAPYSLEEVSEYMKPYFPNEIDRKNLYIAGLNTPAKVNLYKDYDLLQETYNIAFNTFQKLTYISPEHIIEIMKEFEDRYLPNKDDKSNKPVIDRCMLYLKMLISLIENDLNTTSYYSYIDILKIIMSTKRALEKENTLRRKMLLFNMFYQIYELRSDTQ